MPDRVMISNSEDARALEALVDRYSLNDVVDCLSRIAQAKAEHIALNWQDADAASLWYRASDRLYNVAVAIHLKDGGI